MVKLKIHGMTWQASQTYKKMVLTWWLEFQNHYLMTNNKLTPVSTWWLTLSTALKKDNQMKMERLEAGRLMEAPPKGINVASVGKQMGHSWIDRENNEAAQRSSHLRALTWKSKENQKERWCLQTVHKRFCNPSTFKIIALPIPSKRLGANNRIRNWILIWSVRRESTSSK